ncbi:Neuropeptide S receptor, partial [Saguinus oedipus]
MPANFTESSLDSNGTRQTLDSSPEACTETVTFTEVVEGKEWGSFYYSFKDFEKSEVLKQQASVCRDLDYSFLRIQ